jgi:hypothetical protein
MGVVGFWKRTCEAEGEQPPSLLILDVEGPARVIRALQLSISQHLSCCPDCHFEGGFRPSQFDALLIGLSPMPIP